MYARPFCILPILDGLVFQVETPEAQGAKPEPDEYQSLGQFYAAIKQGQRESLVQRSVLAH